MQSEQSKHCCDMRRKVALGIAKIFSLDECGVPDTALADFHDFAYESEHGPVRAALTYRFCPWCGTKKKPTDERRTTEIIR